jgi:hypothetical protein
MKELPASIGAFAAFKQFIIFKEVPSENRPSKTDKLPIDTRSGRTHSAHDSAIWLDHQTAIATAAAWGHPYGVGFVFTQDDPFWFLDFDNCLTSQGQWAPYVLQLCQLLPGAAFEVSRSGKGVHLFGSGKPPVHGCRNDPLDMEFYHSGRFAALTGVNATGDAAKDFSNVLPTLVAVYFTPDLSAGIEAEWTDRPDPAWSGPADDAELIRRAMQSRSAAQTFGDKASFADLFLADEQKLAKAFPDPVRAYNASSADSALAQHLAFWTGKDCERIQRIMYQSKLVRDKWETLRPEGTYLTKTILAVVARQVDVLKAPQASLSPTVLPALPGALETAQTIVDNRYVFGDVQAEIFAGCVYITDSHRAIAPGGHIYKPDQFRVRFGGYTMVMDQQNSRTTRDAWEAFTQSQLLNHPKVSSSCFRPDLPAAEIIHRNGQSFVNTYVQVDVPRLKGDPTPFLEHLARVLPNQNDQIILMSYMAACVQHKGVKFQWAPLLQGVEGNGKTLFTRCVAEAVGRRYVHWPKASKLAKEFNAWMVGKLFFAVEDIYVPDSRREVIEELKPMITGGDGLEIEAKGVDQTSADICGNFMFNSNHRDAIQKTRNDRRFCVLFSAQQAAQDIIRDGMGGAYFPDLYKWLRCDGYAIVSEFLHTFAIPAEFNPAGDCQRAPYSSTTNEAIGASLGGIEQEIQEAIAQGLPGFAGGWISSLAVDRLLEKLGQRAMRVTYLRRKEMLESMGYHWHPALKEGRVNNTVTPDGGKPRLYIHESSLAIQITKIAEVEKAYEMANSNRQVHALPIKEHIK